jgi:site-specific recombinase XerC
MTLIAPTLQAFFTDRLTKQLHASPRTIASYRDSLRLLLCFANHRTGIAPAALDWDDLDEPLITAFLEHLETDRHNSARTRNLRLTAIRALFRYAALRHPEHAAMIARVLGIPAKRYDRRIVTILTAEESAALIDAALENRWEGRRDRAMLTLALHAGLRISELIAVDCADIQLGTGAHVRVEGKGRKHRAVPLSKDAQAVLTVWLDERAGLPDDPLFATRTGRRLPATPSSAASRPTPPPPHSPARRSQASTFTRTRSGTAARCRCCKPASTAPSSPSGSGTPTPAPPSNTSTPT